MSYLYTIEYARLEPVRQFFSGSIITTPETGWMWLKDADKVTLRKGQVSAAIMDSIREGASITAAGFEIRILKQIDKPLSVTTVAPPPKKSAAEKENEIREIQQQRAREREAAAAQEALDKRPTRPSIDPALLAVMRPHQVSAASFLLARLLGEEVSADGGPAPAPAPASDQQQQQPPSSSSSSSSSPPLTGGACPPL